MKILKFRSAFAYSVRVESTKHGNHYWVLFVRFLNKSSYYLCFQHVFFLSNKYTLLPYNRVTTNSTINLHNTINITTSVFFFIMKSCRDLLVCLFVYLNLRERPSTQQAIPETRIKNSFINGWLSIYHCCIDIYRWMNECSLTWKTKLSHVIESMIITAFLIFGGVYIRFKAVLAD